MIRKALWFITLLWMVSWGGMLLFADRDFDKTYLFGVYTWAKHLSIPDKPDWLHYLILAFALWPFILLFIGMAKAHQGSSGISGNPGPVSHRRSMGSCKGKIPFPGVASHYSI